MGEVPIGTKFSGKFFMQGKFLSVIACYGPEAVADRGGSIKYSPGDGTGLFVL